IKLSLRQGAGDKIPIPEFCQFLADEDGEVLPVTEFILPDGKHFRAEFHLHYVRYFLDNREIFQPVYSLKEYMEFSKSITAVEWLIFLLAITKITNEDCEGAMEMIGRLLWHLPLAPVSIPVIARLLAAGEEEYTGGKILTASYPSHASLRMAKKPERYVQKVYEEEKTGDLFAGIMEEEGNCPMGIYYVEDEELCFKAVVFEGGFCIFRQTNLGWEPLYTAAFPDGEKILLDKEKQCAAQEFLQGMKRPKPVLRTTLCLEGMTDVEKAERILSAMKQDALYRGREHGLLPYALGYPFEDKGAALQDFYREHGGYLPEGYCVLRFGWDDTQEKKEHVFYASMKPFGFDLALRSADWPSGYEYSESELHRKVKERHWVVGHFGWGDQIGPDGVAVPKMIALGESGTYYYYDVVRLLRHESLAALLAKMFDFSNVIAVENYEGELSISRFSGELEYCYGREAFLGSAYTLEKTAVDLFTFFTKAELMGEFAVFMDGLLEGITQEPDNLYFEFSYAGDGAYKMQVFLQDLQQQKQPPEGFEEDGTEAGCPVCEDLIRDRKPLVWKIWQQVGNGAQMSRDFKDAMYWYMECGKFGKKLAAWKKIIAGFDLGGGDELVVRLGCKEEEGSEWHRNKMEEQEKNWREYFEEEDFEEEDFEEEEDLD
ncbi:MAG: hypothetical protein K2N63_11680, partial [Lachnospiraceae bacterium]|nr:hypothetical protein [Lachnospiraceae bacterium]